MCLLFLGSVSVLIAVFGSAPNKLQGNYNDAVIDQNPKPSAYTIVDYRIHIKDNWSETAAAYDWVTGIGTEGDPYVIDGISVNLTNLPMLTWTDWYSSYDYTGAAIIIEGSAEYFIIQNSEFINAYTDPRIGMHEACGIYLHSNVEHGIITNNKFFNDSNAIYIRNSEFIQILDNTIIGDPDTNGAAFYLSHTENMIIQGNYIENHKTGVQVEGAKENILVDNNVIIYIKPNFMANGIMFYRVNNSAITNNELHGADAQSIIPTESSQMGLRTAGLGSQAIQIDNSHNIYVAGNKYYDIYGNLIGGTGNFNIVVVIIAIVGAVCVVGLTLMITRKRKTNHY